MKKIFKIISYLLVAVLVGITVSFAGSLTPPGSPANTMYSLTDIYNLSAGTTTTEGAGTIPSTPGGVASTGKTLTEVYTAISDQIALLANNKIAKDITAFGYTGTLYGDTDPSKVLTTATYAGTAVAGADLSNMFTGTGQGIPGGSQQYGGVDDYNNGGAQITDTYTGSWTTCNVGNSYCGTGDSGAIAKDNSTGLIWSKFVNPATYALDDAGGLPWITWYKANNCVETSGSVCTKKTSSKTGCEANEGWYVPNQKQILQAYINGSAYTIPVNAYIWASTTMSDSLSQSMKISTYSADVVTYYAKTSNGAGVRCVR